MDNIQTRIKGWQAKYLSMAGWATLIKASVTSIPIYAMQTTLLPQKISHQIDKMSCTFLWGDTDHHKGCHTVNWETVTLPKEAGVLGIPSTQHRNRANLMNQANFCDSSSQLMSVTKSRLWFSPSTPRRIKEQVAGIFGIPTMDHIGTYLGTPIFTT